MQNTKDLGCGGVRKTYDKTEPTLHFACSQHAWTKHMPEIPQTRCMSMLKGCVPHTQPNTVRCKIRKETSLVFEEFEKECGQCFKKHECKSSYAVRTPCQHKMNLYAAKQYRLHARLQTCRACTLEAGQAAEDDQNWSCKHKPRDPRTLAKPTNFQPYFKL
jgi:hypothetical protein